MNMNMNNTYEFGMYSTNVDYRRKEKKKIEIFEDKMRNKVELWTVIDQKKKGRIMGCDSVFSNCLGLLSSKFSGTSLNLILYSLFGWS